jgi:putative transposase
MQRYPGRLAPQTPVWVETGSTYHIRMSVELDHSRRLTDSKIGPALIDSARFYHEHQIWNCRLFLLMPDHIHALLAFPCDKEMGVIIAAWKGYQSKRHGIRWQDNFFGHRIRQHHELDEKAAYIRLNPVRKNLCAQQGAWPWVISCNPENPSGGRVPP